MDHIDPDTAEAYTRMERTVTFQPSFQRDWKYTRNITDVLMNIWLKMPALRLGQLLENAVGRYGLQNGSGGPDMFNISDEALLDALRRMESELCSGNFGSI